VNSAQTGCDTVLGREKTAELIKIYDINKSMQIVEKSIQFISVNDLIHLDEGILLTKYKYSPPEFLFFPYNLNFSSGCSFFSF
jgi:hypothetical protein